MDPQASLVFWGAFGGGAAAGLFTLLAVGVAEWLRWFVNRPLLKVRAVVGDVESTTGHMASSGALGVGSRKIFLIAANPHTVPLNVSTFGLSYRSKKWGTMVVRPLVGYDFPHQILSGTNLIQWVDVPRVLQELRSRNRNPKDLKYAWFTSSTHKIFRGRLTKETIRLIQTEYDKSDEQWEQNTEGP